MSGKQGGKGNEGPIFEAQPIDSDPVISAPVGIGVPVMGIPDGM